VTTLPARSAAVLASARELSVGSYSMIIFGAVGSLGSTPQATDQFDPAAPPMPASRARMMAPDRSATCSLVMMLET
jgi:hypothetical protein